MIKSIFILFLILWANPTPAALYERVGGFAVYDSDQDITWLADANYAQTSGYDNDNGMTLQEALDWADQLTFAGYSYWRLPATLEIDPTRSDTNTSGLSIGYNCTGNEMAHLFYVDLSGTAGTPITLSGDTDLALFSNIQTNDLGDKYWSGTPYSGFGGDSTGWDFNFYTGYKGADGNTAQHSAWAVADGDVFASIPATPVVHDSTYSNGVPKET